VDQDPTLLAASAWNDHGFVGMVRDEQGHHTEPGATLGVHRAEHFPGLGWLCTRRLWAEIEPNWPEFVWDVWLRTVASGRHTLVPEVPLVQHRGEAGSSMHLVDHAKWFDSAAFSDRAWTTDHASSSPVGLEDLERCAGCSTAEEAIFFSSLEDASRKLASALSEAAYRAALVAELAASTPAGNFWALHRSSANSSSTHSLGPGGTTAVSWRVCYEPSAWRPLASYLGLWPPLPLDTLPVRGLTFDGVTRFRWRIPYVAAGSKVLATMFLVSTASPHHSSSETAACVTEATVNVALPPPPRPVPLRPTGPGPAAADLRARLRLRPSAANESCAGACARRQLWCGPDILPRGRGGLATGRLAAPSSTLDSAEAEPTTAAVAAMDFCPALVEIFGAQCSGGCVAVETPERGPAARLLPALWQDGHGDTHCLISDGQAPIAFDCARASPNARRLCPCLVA
jgi:hypothetical protein